MAGELWEGRFAGSPSEALQALNDSFPFDRRMFREDIAGSRAHVTMLADVGLLTIGERDQLLGGLDAVEAEMAGGDFEPLASVEDIPTPVERRVTVIVGAVGGKLEQRRVW